MGVEVLHKLKTYEKSEQKRFEQQKKRLEASYEKQIADLEQNLEEFTALEEERLQKALDATKQSAEKEAHKLTLSHNRKLNAAKKRAQVKAEKAKQVILEALTRDV